MSKEAIKLTEIQLRNIVAESVMPVMNEKDASIYAIVHNANNKAKGGLQNGVKLESKTADSMVSQYKNINFMFFCKNLRQNVSVTMFKLNELYELTEEKAVLKGEIVFNLSKMNGSIIVDMTTGNATYYHSSSKKKYPLEIDNRFKTQWDSLVELLQNSSKQINAN